MKHAKSLGVKSLKSKQDKAHSIDSQNDNIFHDERSEVKRKKNLDMGELLETDVSVGAFPIPGIIERLDDVEELSVPSRSLSNVPSSKELTSIAITSARLVNDDVVNAVPIQGSRYKFIFLVSLILLVGTIILIVVLTRRSANDPMKDFTNDPPKDPSAEDDLIEKLKSLLTNTSRQKMDIPDSPLSRARDWLLYKSNFTAYSFDRQIQRFAMVALYYSTDGGSWNDQNGWLIHNDECSWYQNSYNEICVNETLQVLSLPRNNLNGPIPEVIALLSNLELLTLSSNELSSSIPIEIKSLTSLTGLNLEYNELTGMIPSEVGNLKKLKEFNIHYNSFTGEIPIKISESTELTDLDIGGLNLNGSIPSEIGALTKLKYISLFENAMVGTIPTEIGQMINLITLNLASNLLTGLIPSEIGQCTNLIHLDISMTNLSGSIPTEIGQLTSLTSLLLSYNYLSGSIPSEFAALQKLQKLDIIQTGVAGTIPVSLCNDFSELNVDSSIECTCCY